MNDKHPPRIVVIYGRRKLYLDILSCHLIICLTIFRFLLKIRIHLQYSNATVPSRVYLFIYLFILKRILLLPYDMTYELLKIFNDCIFDATEFCTCKFFLQISF